jgi:hypothetical protein
MSRWVTGSLDELITLSPEPRAACARARADALDVARFLDDLGADAADRARQIAAVAAQARDLPRMHGALATLAAVHDALEAVRACAAAPGALAAFDPESPLAVYVKELHARATSMGRALARFDTPPLGGAPSAWLVATIRRDLDAAEAPAPLRDAVERLFACAAHADEPSVA